MKKEVLSIDANRKYSDPTARICGSCIGPFESIGEKYADISLEAS